jgi:hypothetical protein
MLNLNRNTSKCLSSCSYCRRSVDAALDIAVDRVGSAVETAVGAAVYSPADAFYSAVDAAVLILRLMKFDSDDETVVAVAFVSAVDSAVDSAVVEVEVKVKFKQL